jgi:hypothetical protein
VSAAATKPPKVKPVAKRVTIAAAAAELGICRQSFYRQGWVDVFTPYKVGRRTRRVCTLELGEAAQHMRGEDATARAKAAVLRLRQALGRIEAGD